MSLIVWRPPLDEIDRIKFPYTQLDDWVSIGAWTGRDMYDQEPLYTLELLAGEVQGTPVRRAILWKFVHMPGTRAMLQPDPIDEENVADAAGHLGFEFFRAEPKGEHGGLWIIEETEDGQPMEYRVPPEFP